MSPLIKTIIIVLVVGIILSIPELLYLRHLVTTEVITNSTKQLLSLIIGGVQGSLITLICFWYFNRRVK